MIIKLCYGAGQSYIACGVGRVEFTNHVTSGVVFDTTTKQLFSVEENGTLHEVTDEFYSCVSSNAVKNLTPFAGDSNKYFVNTCSAFIANTNEWEQYAFSGVGYLCDDNGKTVDVLK